MAKRLKLFKKFLYMLAVFALAFVFVGCAEYKPPKDDEGGGDNPPIVDPEPTPPDDPVIDDDSFSITLEWISISGARGKFTKEVYSKISGLQVQWTDKSTGEVFRAAFDDDGVAKRKGLDGDYTVTLVTLPEGFTYDPNIYEVSNDLKDATLTLHQISPATQGGVYQGTPYYEISTTGAYKVTLKSDKDSVMFYYKPPRQGVYTLKSVMDVTANEVNPILEVHAGNLPAYMNPALVGGKPQDGGGAENTYTKNFLWEYGIYGDEVGGGLIFLVYSTGLNADAYGEDGMDVYFILERDGEFERDDYNVPKVEVTEDFNKWNNANHTAPTPSGTFTYCAKRPGVQNNILDQKTVKLYREEDGGDGYYHYYDAVTETYGDLLYAKMSGPMPVFDGFTHGQVVLYYVNGFDYRDFVSTYVAHSNSDGCYPVNEEIKEFIQNFATANRYFDDGSGWAESGSGAHYNSDEDSQWMFACGYYA